MLDKKFILAPTHTDLDEEIWWEICTAPSGSEIAFIDEPKDQAAIAMEGIFNLDELRGIEDPIALR